MLPLKDWRDDTVDSVCDFSKLETLVIVWDAGKGAVSLDSIRLVPGPRGNESCQPAHDEYVAFFERYGKHYKIGIGAPKADGYSVLGIAAGVLDKQNYKRPSLLHEAMHAAIYRHLRVANNMNWIQEALANAVQIEIHPQSAAKVPFKKHFKALSEGGGGFFVPLPKLLASKQVTMKNYAQLASFAMFLADERGEQLPAFWEKVRALPDRISKAAAPALAEAVGAGLDALQATYVAWGLKRFR